MEQLTLRFNLLVIIEFSELSAWVHGTEVCSNGWAGAGVEMNNL